MLLNIKHILIIFLAVSALLLIGSREKAFAQQTIFNVPSADVTEKGHLFLEPEAQFSDKFGLFTGYVAYGIGHHTALNLTVTGVGTRNIRDELLCLGSKTYVKLHEKSETKFTAGYLIPISLRGNGVGGYAYSHLSTRLPKIKTRITSGVLVATTVIFGRDVVAYIGGIEQPITKKLSLILDYTSGNHPNGLLISGFSYKLPSNIVLVSGYQIPNNRHTARKGFVIEVVKNL